MFADGEDGGPEQPEEPTAARDGEGTNVKPFPGRTGKPLEEQETADEPQPPEPIKADHQLTLAGLGRRGLPITSEISIMSKTHPLDGMIKPDEEVTLVIRVRPNKYVYAPERQGREVVGFKHTHQLRVVDVAKAGTGHADALLQMGAKEEDAA